MGLDGRKAGSEHFIMDEDSTLSRGKVGILEPWARVFGILLSTKSPKFDRTIGALFPQRPLAPSLGDEPIMDDMTAGIRGMPSWKAGGPDSLPAELLKIGHPELIRYCHNLLVTVWRTGDAPQQLKYVTNRALHKEKDRFDCNKYRGISLVVHSGEVLLKMVKWSRPTSATTARVRVRTKEYSPTSSAAFAYSSAICSPKAVRPAPTAKTQTSQKKTCARASSISIKHTYDSVKPEILWVVLERSGVPEKIYSVIRQCHEGVRACVRTDDGGALGIV